MEVETNMKRHIAILGKDKQDYRDLCAFLSDENYFASAVCSFDNLEELIRNEKYHVLLLDIDAVNTNKNLFRNLKKVQPLLKILCISERTFHPELADIMNNYIYACLKKPVDEDELIFILRGLC